LMKRAALRSRRFRLATRLDALIDAIFGRPE